MIWHKPLRVFSTLLVTIDINWEKNEAYWSEGGWIKSIGPVQ